MWTPQVAEEVGELKVHCYYGCKLKDPSTGEYEVDPQGTRDICVLMKINVKKTATSYTWYNNRANQLC